MHYPELYEETTLVTIRDTTEILKNYSHLFKWRPDQKDTVLEFGCGPGTITHDIILPFLPSTFSKIVGADISEEMIEYAKSKYVHPKLQFCLINIEDTNINKYFPKNDYGAAGFDHIISSFCLHWVENQKQALKNIYNLLNPNGDCLLIIAGRIDTYDTYPKLAKMEKWSKYMQDYKKHISPYHYVDNLKEEHIKFLQFGGFTNYKVDILEGRSHKIRGLTNIKSMKSI